MKNFGLKTFLIALGCLLVAGFGLALDRYDLRHSGALLKRVNQVQAVAGKTSAIATALGMSADESLRSLRQRTDRNGVTHTRYAQEFQGVPVWGEHIIVSENNQGEIVRLGGRMVEGLDQEIFAVDPGYTADSAMRMAKQVHASRNALSPKGIKYENESSELVIFISERGQATLSYAVSFFADRNGAPSRPTLILDANSQEVLLEFDGLTTANATGPGGNNKTGQYFYGTDFGFLDVSFSGGTSTMTNANVKTVNLNHGTSGSTAYSFSGTENTFKTINGAFSPLNDAHYFGGVVFDMFNDWVGSPPLTFQLQMRVHYGNNYENAFWNGSAMTFGDGASIFYPLVSLDVSSHEVAHGFTEQNSALIYANQSGGINEAYSDMAGEAAENYMHGSNDWLVGAEIFKGSGALRYMNNPPLDGVSIDSANDYYAGLDVHYSSGVFNKAFYLLATTAGWSTQTAFQTFTKANQDYWTPSATYISAAQGVVDAANDLGFNTADVEAAFSAVDVVVNTGPCTPSGLDFSRSGLSKSSGWLRSSFDIPEGTCELVFTISGGTGDADLYTRFGSQPTTSAYDCRPYLNGNNESCVHSYPAAGTWYIGIRAYSAFTGLTATVTN